MEIHSCVSYYTYNDEEIAKCFREMQNGEEFILAFGEVTSGYILTGFSCCNRVIHLTSSGRFSNRGSLAFNLGTGDEDIFYKVKEAY